MEDLFKPRWYGGFFVYEFREGWPGIWVQDTTYTHPRMRHRETEIKIFGGTEEDGDEDPLITALRELFEEGRLSVDIDQSRIISIGRFYAELQEGEELTEGQEPFFREFFAVPRIDCTGELRNEVAYGRKTKLGIPYWLPLGGPRGVETKIYKTQLGPLELFKRRLNDPNCSLIAA